MTVQLPQPGTYIIDAAASKIAFRAKHQFGLGTVYGSFALTSGEIVVNDPVAASTVRAVADATSFESGSPARDKKVRSKAFLHVDEHTDIVFASKAFEQVDGAWHLRGRITARGVSADTDFVVTELQQDGDTLTISATATVDRYAHGMTALKGMAGRHLWLTATVRAQRTPH